MIISYVEYAEIVDDCGFFVGKDTGLSLSILPCSVESE